MKDSKDRAMGRSENKAGAARLGEVGQGRDFRFWRGVNLAKAGSDMPGPRAGEKIQD